jgi:peptide/nickel transport system substrate-binding protein
MEPITRRDYLKMAVVGSLAIGAGDLLAACGSSSTHGTSTAVAPRRGGTLRAAITGGGSTDTLNPLLLPLTDPSFARILNLFDPLVLMNPAGQPELALAEEIIPNADATRWTIRLRQGVEFHNGKPLTVDDVIYTYHVILNPKTPGWAAPGLASIDPTGFRKRDKYTLDMTCRMPFATLLETLATSGNSTIIPIGFDDKHPVGTGPFKFVSFSPGVQSTFSRNPNYWRPGRPYLNEVVITDYADETSQTNALLAGQIDVADHLSGTSIGQLTSAGKRVLISDAGGWNPFTMRVDVPPFNDVRVRQALRLAIDRRQMLDLVYGGHGTLGNDVFGIFAAEYDRSLPQRVQDIAHAKSLLKAAGKEGLTLEIVTADIVQGAIQATQVLAKQAAAAGINVEVRQVQVTEFFGSNYLKWPFAQDVWLNNYYFPQAALATLPTSAFNETHFNNTRYNSLYQQAIAELDETKRSELAHEMQQIEYNEGGYIIPFFPAVIDGYAPNVHGLIPTKSGLALRDYTFSELWLT